MRRRSPLAPGEGWLTLGLVSVICLALAWSGADSRWGRVRDGDLDYLVLAAMGGVLTVFIGTGVGWG